MKLQDVTAFALGIALLAPLAQAQPDSSRRSEISPSKAAHGARRHRRPAAAPKHESVVPTAPPPLEPDEEPAPTEEAKPTPTPTVIAAPVVTTAAPIDRAAEPEPRQERPRPFALTIESGITTLAQSFDSNGAPEAGRRVGYDFAASGMGLRASASITKRLGPVFRVGLGGSYRYAGLTSITVPTYGADGADVPATLSLMTHDGSLHANVGTGFESLGGLDVRLCAGGNVTANYVDTDARAPLPSERTVGLSTGLTFTVPRLLVAANRAFGFSAYAFYLGPSVYDQTGGLEDGKGETRVLRGGAALQYSLTPIGAPVEVGVLAGFHLVGQTTDYTGSSTRNGPSTGNVTTATRTESQRLMALGLHMGF